MSIYSTEYIFMHTKKNGLNISFKPFKILFHFIFNRGKFIHFDVIQSCRNSSARCKILWIHHSIFACTVCDYLSVSDIISALKSDYIRSFFRNGNINTAVFISNTILPIFLRQCNLHITIFRGI